MGKDLNIDGLENGKVADTNVDAKKAEKKAKVQASVEAAAELIKDKFDVSSELAKTIDLAVSWDADKEAKDAAKAECIEGFGGSDAIRDYATTAMNEEMEGLKGLTPLVSRLNNIRHFYARRKGSGTGRKKVATMQLKIDGEFYSVDKAFYATIADQPREEKMQAILEHAGTVEEAIIEL